MLSQSMHHNLSESFPWLVADIGGSNARFGYILQNDMLVQ